MKNKGPDFISISPHKTGTSWLYFTLKQHPEIWLPPKKELWILNQQEISYIERIKGYFHLVGMPGDNIKEFFRNSQSLSSLAWWIKFLLYPYKISNYHLFFPSSRNYIRGDITPNYYFIKNEIIEKLARVYPTLKIILTIRNPVDRVWSYTKMHIKEFAKEDISTYNSSKFIKLFDEFKSWWVPYDIVIEKWKKYYPNLLILPFDELKNSPYNYLHKVLKYLNANLNFIPGHIEINKIINKSSDQTLSSNLKIYLYEQYEDEIKKLGLYIDKIILNNWNNV